MGPSNEAPTEQSDAPTIKKVYCAVYFEGKHSIQTSAHLHTLAEVLKFMDDLKWGDTNDANLSAHSHLGAIVELLEEEGHVNVPSDDESEGGQE